MNRISRKYGIVFGMLAFLLFCNSLTEVRALVNYRNGNYYMSYSDHALIGKWGEFELTFTYNSKSAGVGLFGYGWGSFQETRLWCVGDGSIHLVHYGTGGRSTFTPLKPNESQIDSCLQTLMAAALENDAIKGSPLEIMHYMHTLRNSEHRRYLTWRKYRANKWIDDPEFPVGQKLVSEEESGDLTVLREGFLWNKGDGEIYRFDKQGRLISYENRSGLSQKLTWKEDKLREIRAGKEKLRFHYNPSGHLEKITSKRGKSVYEFDRNNNLISVEDAEGTLYRMSYDLWHNLTRVLYGNGEDLRISYHPGSQNVARVIDRYQDTVSYHYGFFYDDLGRKNENHYYTRVTRRNFNGRLNTNYYEYEIRRGLNGAAYTYRILSEINGTRLESIYNYKGLPLKKSRGSLVTTYKYSRKGRLLEKESTTGDYTRITYTDRGKMESVDHNGNHSYFTYNEKNDLVFATDGKDTVRLFYSKRGKISRIENGQYELKISYNKIGKPATIRLVGGPMVRVKYNKDGEIIRVRSRQGHPAAIKVIQIYQSLVKIVDPPGVNLNM